ncbi:hypothetical protein BIU82_04525 [Arthrobacter sp. SW1]|uniref:hypothetical protein n=1 Tax=Arthrobacter sp. SW1 TaxID=1920889 RepID=UPI000877DEDA|nr:hypothetical protein [Arthrobacter sp. SW1]OFI38589.1 hypothetical protein BIU82_04525 [Arthrobacter sp. SW1]
MTAAKPVPFHAARSIALALTVFSLAAGAHVIAGGALPVAPILLALLALTALTTTLATRFKLAFPWVAALLGGGQLLLHETFTMLGPVSAAGAVEAPHVHHPSMPMPAVENLADHAHTVDGAFGWAMLAGHVVASATSALLFAKGEAALWQLAAWLRPLWRAVTPSFRPDAGTRPALHRAPEAHSPRPWRNLRQDSRRGPPSSFLP